MMRVVIASSLLVGAVVSASPAMADSAAVAASGVPAPAAVPAPKTKLVCKSVQVTGSRFPERQCATREIWAKAEEEGKKGADDLLNRPMNNTAKGD